MPRMMLLSMLLLLPSLAAAQEAQTPPPDRSESNELEGSDEDRSARLRRVTRKTTELALGGGTVSIAFGFPGTDSTDFEQITELEAGGTVLFTESAAVKLSTTVDLRIGEALVPAENVAPDYPGVYSLWLQRTDSGWDLAFNEKADVWGTRHDPSADVARTPLSFAGDHEPSEAFGIELFAEGDGAELRISWGSYSWTAPVEATGEE